MGRVWRGRVFRIQNPRPEDMSKRVANSTGRDPREFKKIWDSRNPLDFEMGVRAPNSVRLGRHSIIGLFGVFSRPGIDTL